MIQYRVLVLAILIDICCLTHVQAEKISLTSGNISIEIEIDDSFPEDKKEILISDLEFLASITGGESTSLHREIFKGDVDGETYVKWLGDRIDTIYYSEEGPHETTKAYYNDDYFFDYPILQTLIPLHDHKVTLTAVHFQLDSDYGSDFNRISRVSTLLHEARHSEGFHHVDCPDPIEMTFEPYDRLPKFNVLTDLMLENKDVCDASYNGAYGVEVIFLINYYKHHSAPNNLQISDAERIISLSARRILNEDLIAPMTPRTFSEMVHFDDHERLLRLINEGLDQRYIDECLFTAVSEQKASMIELLIESNADFDPVKEEFLNSVFITHIYDFSLEFIRHIISTYAVDINSHYINGLSPLCGSVIGCDGEQNIKDFLYEKIDRNNAFVEKNKKKSHFDDIFDQIRKLNELRQKLESLPHIEFTFTNEDRNRYVEDISSIIFILLNNIEPDSDSEIYWRLDMENIQRVLSHANFLLEHEYFEWCDAPEK